MPFSVPLIFFLLSPKVPRVHSYSLFCSYPHCHFKESGHNHRPSQPFPLTTHPNTKTTTASCPASSFDWQRKVAMWVLWLTSLPPTREQVICYLHYLWARPSITKWTPALMAGWGRGTLKHKMNRSLVLVRHSIPSKHAPKAFKEHLTLKEYYKGSLVFTLL